MSPQHASRPKRRSPRPALRALAWLACLAIAVQLPAAQNDLISVLLEKDELVAGQRFGFAIRLHDNGLAVPEARVPELGPRVSLVSGPEISTETVVDETGRQRRFVFMRYQAKANSAGYAELPPISVSYGVQRLQTDSLLLTIARQDSAYVPPDLVWKVHSPRLWRGQSVFISLELVNCPSIVFPDQVDIPPLSGGSFEALADSGRISTVRLADRNFQSIPVAAFMFTPSAAGTLSLPAARVLLGKHPVQTAAQTLVVEAPPLGAEGAMAIGELKFSASLESPELRLGGSTRLSVRVEGTGNLKSLALPEPLLSGLAASGSIENLKLVASETGYRGYRETVYTLEASEPGQAFIDFPPLSWLDFAGELHTVRLTPLRLRVGESGGAGGKAGGQARVPLSLEQLFTGPQPDAAKRNGWQQLLQESERAFLAKDYDAAQAALSQAVALSPLHHGVLYNLGLVCQSRGSLAQAGFYWQRALRLAPWEALYRSALEENEASLGLENQLPLLALPAPGWLVLVLSLGVLSAVVSAVVALRRRNFLWWAAAAVSLVVAIAFGAALGYGHAQANQPFAVVAEAGALLKRIPEPGARDWLRLANGMSLKVGGRSKDFVLVETAFGIKGWVDHSALYLVEEKTE